MTLFSLSRYLPEPSIPAVGGGQAGALPDTAVLFCNLGTPDAPTAAAVRRFLAAFLGDPRVVEIPRLLWWLILNGIILRVRPAKSAAKYASIWRKETPVSGEGGSPLRYWTVKQASLLHGWLGQRGHTVRVLHAMRYGSQDEPDSIAHQLTRLKSEGVRRVLLLPAYPQYSSTTTASLFDAVYEWALQTRSIPELRFINRYHDDPGYIAALAASVRKHSQQHGRPGMLVMSFHGVPERTRDLGDPYYGECMRTASLLAQALGLEASHYKVTFQSRLGRAQWLQPYTEPTLIALAQSGVPRVDVICPGFNCDGLETLEEIDQEGRAAFMEAGGQAFHYIPCLNDSEAWIDALCGIADRHLAGWDTLDAPQGKKI
jgi:protoporphyrin/coproporphyrin ferrochelatase